MSLCGLSAQVEPQIYLILYSLWLDLFSNNVWGALLCNSPLHKLLMIEFWHVQTAGLYGFSRFRSANAASVARAV